ncbi:perlucin-like protein [Mytilus edulis]|uniref:perlucin-like protein n=1 Tax=Mytilus edulis TaxID=6550 RepID=UPI0039F00DFA
MIMIRIILYTLALSTILFIVNGKQTCLAPEEKTIIKTIRNSMQQLNSQITGLEDSLKLRQVIETSGCQNGWTRYRNHCYFFSLNKLDWFEAQRHCHKHGSTLAKIDDANENAWISLKTKELQLSAKNLLWLGGSDLKDGHWLWMADYSPFSYVNWRKGNGEREPNGGTRENCLNMLSYQTYRGTWNDYPCDYKMRYLCKKNLKCDCEGKRKSKSNNKQ